MLADAALAQVGLADIPSLPAAGGGPTLFTTSLLGGDANAQLFGGEPATTGVSGGKANAQLFGNDVGVSLQGNKSNPTVH